MAQVMSIYQAFEEFAAMQRRSTATTYRHAIRRWTEWCASNRLNPAEVRRVHLEKWRRWMVEVAGNGEGTAALNLSIVLNAYKYALSEGIIDTNPGEQVIVGAVYRHSQTDYYTRDELARFLDVARRDESPYLWAAACLMSLHGLRIGEVIAARLDDLGDHGEMRTLRLRTRKRHPLGQRISLTATTTAAVNSAGGSRKSGPIVQIRGTRVARPKPMTLAGALRAQLYALQELHGLRRVTPHGLRTTFVTLARDAGVLDRDIMASTGHASVNSMAYYDRAAAAIDRNAGHQLESWLTGTP